VRDDFSLELRIRHEDGSWRFVGCTASRLSGDPGGQVLVLNARDITARRNAEEALRASEERYRLIYENASDMIAVCSDDGGAIRYANPATGRTLGYRPESLAGRPAYDLIHPDDIARVREALGQARSRGEGTVELRCARRDGSYLWIEATGRSIQDENDQTAVLLIARDITQRVQHREELRALSLEDELTGVNNRRGFFRLADQQLKFANRTQRALLLFFVDVDNMKWINDNLGHKEGDLALIETAHVLTEAFRDSDIVGRVGGDEFAVLAIEAPETQSDALMARLDERLAVRNAHEGRKYELSLSVGIATYNPADAVSLDELIARADALMYEHKRSKGNGR
jgi:diguanylate cyclase (GGDEF)-like protein/PAS domain S-box-containing protein